MSGCSYPTKPCHNCRRQRLKCDRSHPQCHKCIRAGQECFGYGELFRWNKGVASRGRMMGLTFEEGKQKKHAQTPKISSIKKHADENAVDSSSIAYQFPPPIVPGLEIFRVPRKKTQVVKLTGPTLSYSLKDPFFQDLDRDTRCYLDYFTRHVCKDLVCYDVPNHNLFRDLIPLTRGYPVLFHAIIAISALHMSNASQSSVLKAPFMLPRLQTTTTIRAPVWPNKSSKVYEQALLAKQRALGMLRGAITDTQLADLEIILASVLLFVEFELINSGRDDWRFHINGAKRLIDSLQSSCILGQGSVSRMCSFLISNCAVYDILGSMLARPTSYKSPYASSAQLYSAFESSETNNYLSCPAILLQLVLTATELSHSISQESKMNPTIMTSTPAQQISLLLLTARSFDAVVWAADLQKFSPYNDAEKRVHIASAHKAAVCIYISRAASLFSQTVDLGDDLESLVSDVIHHLSFITCDDGLFKATSWPAFIAGVETKDSVRQEWAMKHLYELWDFCPWGYIQSAVEILNMIWEKRNSITSSSNASLNWVQELRSLGVDWLIA